MKLLHKTNIYSSVVTVVLLIIGLLMVYFSVIAKIDAEVDEHLLNNKAVILDLLRNGKPYNSFNENIGERIQIQPIEKQTQFIDLFRDYQFVEGDADKDDANEEIKVRELYFQTTIDGQALEVSVTRSLSEGIELSEFIATTIFLFLFLALMILFLINSYISRWIFTPFYQTLSRIRRWSVSAGKKLDLPPTGIDEFAELNTTVKSLTEKIIDDFTNLKEFTENISHETQTPVAIISGKLELLMQDPEVSEERRKLLMDTYKATQRLKRLNQTLVSLTRIENNQYSDSREVNLKEMLHERLEEFQDFMLAKNIRLEESLEDCHVVVSEELLDMLINNLLMNAIRYNLDNHGTLRVQLTARELRITNTGADNAIPKDALFVRFRRHHANEESLGLGLSIVKRITERFGWTIRYEHRYDMHTFILSWV